MRYWFTTHWPPRENEPAERTPNGVWVPDGKLHVIEKLSPGDLIWIYEAATGPTKEERDGSGNTKRIRSRRGKMGVVGLVEALEPPKQLAGSEAETYVGRPEIWWKYHAATRPVNTAGFIPLSEAVVLLGHKPGWNLHGYGGGSGLKEIDSSAHQRLLAAYVSSSQSDLSTRLARLQRGVFGPGGEGPEHRALKEKIAAHPAATLGEAGLRLIKKEMQFPTGDRIDVVLEDQYGRLVAVEVEVDCASDEVIGPLQCMKYGALLAYRFDRDPLEVRKILAAHSVHQIVEEKCSRYEIEIVKVSR